MVTVPFVADKEVAVPFTTSPPVTLPFSTEVAATALSVPAAKVMLPFEVAALPFRVRLPVLVERLTSPAALTAPRFIAILLTSVTAVALVTET